MHIAQLNKQFTPWCMQISVIHTYTRHKRNRQKRKRNSYVKEKNEDEYVKENEDV